jgi:hypothetical protein
LGLDIPQKSYVPWVPNEKTTAQPGREQRSLGGVICRRKMATIRANRRAQFAREYRL